MIEFFFFFLVILYVWSIGFYEGLIDISTQLLIYLFSLYFIMVMIWNFTCEYDRHSHFFQVSTFFFLFVCLQYKLHQDIWLLLFFICLASYFDFVFLMIWVLYSNKFIICIFVANLVRLCISENIFRQEQNLKSLLPTCPLSETFGSSSRSV